jgi:hypothetical protein
MISEPLTITDFIGEYVSLGITGTDNVLITKVVVRVLGVAAAYERKTQANSETAGSAN